MLDERMSAVLALLGSGDPMEGAAGLDRRVAALAAAALGVDGICAGVGTGPEGAVIAWGRETVAVAVEGLEFTLGQGPSRDAVLAGVPVLVPDIDLPDPTALWPAFAYGVAGFAVRAVFAFPLRIGAISVGVLTAHRALPGSLTAEQLADALTLADAVTLLLVHQECTESDMALVPGREPGPRWGQAATYRADVHQATGMISMQLEVSLAEALVRLRAHAYRHDRPVGQIALDVLARRLRFTEI
jgi:hypothetical protein